MKIKLKDLEGIVVSLIEQSKKKYPAKLSYAVSRNKNTLYNELETFLGERVKILKRECIKDGDGNPKVNEKNEYMYDNEEIKNVVLQELNDLLNTEIETKIMMVDFDVIQKCDSDQFDSVSGSDIDALEFMLE